MVSEKNISKVLSDNPIEHVDDDVLNRKDYAKSFAKHVLNLDCSKGVVVGIFAPWGHGKTSFFNLARTEFQNANVQIFDFNPWMFSGAEQLVDRFFNELSSEMLETGKVEKIASALKNYGDVLSTASVGISKVLGAPIVGEIVKGLLDTSNNRSHQPTSTIKLRKEVEKALEESKKTIIVVLDDVDRLTTSEIREIFKMIRLTASFPNLIYVVLCDRDRVEQALGEQGLSGQDYLEKIIQFPYDLPAISKNTLEFRLKREIEHVTECFEDIDKEDPTMLEVYTDIICPLIRNMRDIRRYVTAIQETLRSLNGKVALADVLGLEAVRLFLPDVFKLIPNSIDTLTVTSTSKENERHASNCNRVQRAQEYGIVHTDDRLEKLIEAGQQHQVVIQSLLSILFFNINRHNALDVYSGDKMAFSGAKIQDRRVAHEHILLCYLERVVSPELVEFHRSEKIFNIMANSINCQQYVLSIQQHRLGVISNLFYFKYRFSSDQTESGIVAMLNLLPDLVKETELDVSRAISIVNVVIKSLLEAFVTATKEEDSSTARVNLVDRILKNVNSLSSKWEFLKQIKPIQIDTSEIYPFISTSELDRFRQSLCEEIQNFPKQELVREFNLTEFLLIAKSEINNSLHLNCINDEDCPEITFAVLRSALTINTSSELGSRHTEMNIGIQSDNLLKIFDSWEEVAKRIINLENNFNSIKPLLNDLNIQHETAEQILAVARAAVSKNIAN